MDRVKKIVDAYPDNCPYCFKKLKPKFVKATSAVQHYCSTCEIYIDIEWDYLHAIAKVVKKYSVVKDDTDLTDLRRKLEE